MTAFSSADPNAYVSLAMQAAQGTPNVTASKQRFAKYLAGNGFTNEPAVVDIREGGDGLDWGATYKRAQTVRGQLVFNARPEMLGQALQFLPGGATWDGATAPAGITFHDNHASFPYGTMVIQHPGSDLTHLLSDVRFTGFTLEAQAGMPHKFTMPFVGITMSASAVALVPTYYGDDFFLYHVGPSYLLDGVADTSIESWRLECRLGIEELQAQSILLDDVVVQNRDYDFTCVRRYQNASQWAKIAYGGGKTPTQSVATGAWKSVNQYGAAGATLRYLQLDIPLLSYRNDVLTELNPDGQTVKETITAKPLSTASVAIQFLLKNAHASAYAP